MISVDIIEWILWLFNPLMLGGNKSSCTFKQICSLSLCDIMSPPGLKDLKDNAYKNAFSWPF